jgi:hypothetical protein
MMVSPRTLSQGFQVSLAFEEIMFSLLLSLPPLAAVLVLASPFPLDLHVAPNGSVLVPPAAAAPVPHPGSGPNCYPAIGFKTPSEVPNSTAGWWCDPTTEYAFLGFSYEVTACAYLVLGKSISMPYFGAQVRA